MRHPFGPKTEGRGIGIARLKLETRPIDGAAIEPRRSTRLQTAASQTQFLQRFAEENGRWLAGTSRRVLLLATVDETVQERPGGDDYSVCTDGPTVAKTNANNPPSVISRWSRWSFVFNSH